MKTRHKFEHTFYKFKFILSVTGTLLLSSAELFGIKVSLPETPLGTYEMERILPVIRRRLPESHFLDMTPAKDQGPLGTCASFATVGCGEYYYPQRRFSDAEFTVLAEMSLQNWLQLVVKIRV